MGEQVSASDQHEPHNINPKSSQLPGGRLRRSIAQATLLACPTKSTAKDGTKQVHDQWRVRQRSRRPF